MRHEIELVCPAENIPEFLEGDLSTLDINDSLHISAITLPEGVRPTVKRDFTIASVVAPSGMAEPTRTAEAEAAEGEAAESRSRRRAEARREEVRRTRTSPPLILRQARDEGTLRVPVPSLELARA